jgi:hypothetical protein
MSERSLQKWFDQELEVMVHVHEVRNEYEKQSQLYVTLIFSVIIWTFRLYAFFTGSFFFVIEGALHLVRSLPF